MDERPDVLERIATALEVVALVYLDQSRIPNEHFQTKGSVHHELFMRFIKSANIETYLKGEDDD